MGDDKQKICDTWLQLNMPAQRKHSSMLAKKGRLHSSSPPMNLKKIQKPEVMWWNCPWEAAGVRVAPHTVAAMKAKARTREAVCPVKTSINWFVCYFCLFPIAESRDSPWMCTWSHPFLPLLGAETIKSSRCLVTCTSAGLCLSKALTRALNRCGQEGEGPYVSPTS